jgi:hypothetical protein
VVQHRKLALDLLKARWHGRHLPSTKGRCFSAVEGLLAFDDPHEDINDCKSARKGVICFLAR